MGIEKEVKILSEGDIYIIPAGLEHYAKSCSGRAQVLDIFTPVREDYKY
jgi:quercetin dioxygenase-like cupin family protein